MRKLFLYVFLAFSTNFSHAADIHPKDLIQEFIENKDILLSADQVTSEWQIAFENLESLAIFGEENSFIMLCALAQSIEAKAEFIKNFLCNDLGEEAFTYAKKFIVKNKGESSQFMEVLLGLINQDQDADLIKENFKTCLGDLA